MQKVLLQLEWLRRHYEAAVHTYDHVALLGPFALSAHREMIIKRVSNTLDGSHPSAAGVGEADNVFDEPVHHLLQYQMDGLPLPYFILLKIAQDILSTAQSYS